MTPQQFITRWKRSTLSERSACQQHLCDLCQLLDQPTPAAADPDGTSYTFERGVRTTDGGHGWADVWKRGHFGWEYKGKHKDLAEAYRQLLRYRKDLDNPPLLVVCDMDRFEVHTNFTGTAKQVYAFDLDGLAKPENLDVLRKLFTDPEALRPGQTSNAITEQASERFGQLADGLRIRGICSLIKGRVRWNAVVSYRLTETTPSVPPSPQADAGQPRQTPALERGHRALR